MFDWQELIAIAIVLLCILNLMRVFLRTFSGGQSHCGGCSGCGGKKQKVAQIASLERKN
ncbi:MAG: FeoB-associated Cys-rich membrane protein [bacterium]|jgi:hypothetical protein